MKPHKAKIDIFYQQIESKQSEAPITREEFNEWRQMPATQQMFDDFEYKLARLQGDLAESPPSDRIPAAHAEVHAYQKAVADIFEWIPKGLDWEDGE